MMITNRIIILSGANVARYLKIKKPQSAINQFLADFKK